MRFFATPTASQRMTKGLCCYAQNDKKGSYAENDKKMTHHSERNTVKRRISHNPLFVIQSVVFAEKRSEESRTKCGELQTDSIESKKPPLCHSERNEVKRRI